MRHHEIGPCPRLTRAQICAAQGTAHASTRNLEADSWPTNLAPKSPPATWTGAPRLTSGRLPLTALAVRRTSRAQPARTNQPTAKPAGRSAVRTPTVGRPRSPASEMSRIRRHDRRAPAQTSPPTKRGREAVARPGQPRPLYHHPGQAGVQMPISPPGPPTSPTPHRLSKDRQPAPKTSPTTTTPPRVGLLSNGLLRHSRRTHDLRLHLRPGIHPRRTTQLTSNAQPSPPATIGTATTSTPTTSTPTPSTPTPSTVPPPSPIRLGRHQSKIHPSHRGPQVCGRPLTPRGRGPHRRQLLRSDPIPSPAHRPVGRPPQCLPACRQLSSGNSHLAYSRAGSPPASKVRRPDNTRLLAS